MKYFLLSFFLLPVIQKGNKKTFNFSMTSYGITSTVMGSGSILLNQKPQNGFQGSDKKETRHCRIR